MENSHSMVCVVSIQDQCVVLSLMRAISDVIRDSQKVVFSFMQLSRKIIIYYGRWLGRIIKNIREDAAPVGVYIVEIVQSCDKYGFRSHLCNRVCLL